MIFLLLFIVYSPVLVCYYIATLGYGIDWHWHFSVLQPPRMRGGSGLLRLLYIHFRELK